MAGDLVGELDVTAEAGGRDASMGETLAALRGADVQVTIRFQVPAENNANGDSPKVHHVDLIVGDVRQPVADRNLDTNETTKVVARFAEKDWRCTGDVCTMTTTLSRLNRNIYLRVRGTNTTDTEPPMDVKGENPWSDLWFYSNPIFVEMK